LTKGAGEKGIVANVQQVNFYLSSSNNGDMRQVIVGLQELFFLFEKGLLLTRQAMLLLKSHLKYHIATSNNVKVRKWSYMLSTFVRDYGIAELCVNNFEKEDWENKIWIISVLSASMDEQLFWKTIHTLPHDFSSDIINLAAYLYSDYSTLGKADVKRIASGDDDIALYLMGNIAGYHNLAIRNKHEILVHEDIIYDLSKNPNENISEPFLGAMWLQRKLEIPKISFDYSDYLSMNDAPRKWLLSVIWRDENLIKKLGYDFLFELLSIDRLFMKTSPEVREGFARGLVEYKYDEKIASFIIQWFSYETRRTIIYFLLGYINKYAPFNSDFEKIINDELQSSAEIDDGYKKQIALKLPASLLEKTTILGGNFMNALDRKKVFVVHGRNEKIRKSMFDFLRSIGLNPIEWDEAKKMTGKPTPYVGEVLNVVFSNAQAVVVLLTPDDEAKLKDEFIQNGDGDHERNLTPQARPNVIYEAGMAMGKCPERTIIVEFGTLRPYSDIAGLNVIRMSNDVSKRNSLIAALKTAGADTDDITYKQDWMSTGVFDLI